MNRVVVEDICLTLIVNFIELISIFVYIRNLLCIFFKSIKNNYAISANNLNFLFLLFCCT